MPQQHEKSFVDRFMKRVSTSFGDVLFETLPDVQFFVKDTRGRYVKVNQSLKDNYLMADDLEIVGKTDHELFPHYLADNYVRDDKQVFHGASIQNRIELVGHYDGTASWSITTKTPLCSNKGQIIGLAGITRDLQKTSSSVLPFQRLDAVTRHIEENYECDISLETLAKVAKLSIRSLQRKFRAVFRITPSQYVARLRIIKASKLLATTDMPIVMIAASTGFSDQSHLTRKFVSAVGETPSAFRKRHYQTNDE